MILYVLQSKGSSPGRQGFFMIITNEGAMEGTIGGGIMEHKFVELAKEKLKKEVAGEEPGIKRQVHDKEPAIDQSGMICSGEQTILLYRLGPKDENTVNAIIHCLENNRNGSLHFSPAGIEYTNDVPKTNFHYQYNSASDWNYLEKLGYKNELTIIGGGHCSLALSRLMSGMDFYIRVFDNRKGLKTMTENIYAHEKHEIDEYGQLARLVQDGHSHFVVIMTFGYRTDDEAVRALKCKNFAYAGLLGSENKISKMKLQYEKEGLNDGWLTQIHSPVGVPIRSQTAEEIAISIAAEIIREKNKDLP
jgi:xanthine dehydrogenase accessory factor